MQVENRGKCCVTAGIAGCETCSETYKVTSISNMMLKYKKQITICLPGGIFLVLAAAASHAGCNVSPAVLVRVHVNINRCHDLTKVDMLQHETHECDITQLKTATKHDDCQGQSHTHAMTCKFKQK